MHRAQRLFGHIQSAQEQPGLVAPLPTAAAPSAGGVMKNKVCIITGSGQGIGAEAARLFAAEGAKVVVTDLDAAKSDAVAEDIKSNGGIAISVPGDVTDPAFPERIVKRTVEAFGEVHHLVNNAGYTWDGTLHRMTDKQWQAMLDVHNTAPFRLIRALTPYFREAGKREIKQNGKPQDRSIVNISSTSGLHGNFGQANYATAKMGIVGLSKTVAKEWGRYGVRCNTLAFGMINTRLTQAKEKGAFHIVDGKKIPLGIPMGSADEKKQKAAKAMVARTIPLARPGHVSDAAGSILMLCSPYASYVTGHTLECTGGAGI